MAPVGNVTMSDDCQPRSERDSQMLSEAQKDHKNLLDEYIEYKMTVAYAFAEADQQHLLAAQARAENEELRASLQDKVKENEDLSTRLADMSKEKGELRSIHDQSCKENPQQEVLERLMRREVESIQRENVILAVKNSSLRRELQLLHSEIVKSKERCKELVARVETITQERDDIRRKLEREDKLDPDEVEAAFKQVCEQLKRKLKEKTSRCLELELNCKKLAAERDDWKAHVEVLSEELSNIAVDNKNLQDCMTRFKQYAQKVQMEKSYLSSELRKLRGAPHTSTQLPTESTAVSVTPSSRWLPSLSNSSLWGDDYKPPVTKRFGVNNEDRKPAAVSPPMEVPQELSTAVEVKDSKYENEQCRKRDEEELREEALRRRMPRRASAA